MVIGSIIKARSEQGGDNGSPRFLLCSIRNVGSLDICLGGSDIKQIKEMLYILVR